jgi:hypothetical protein
MASPPPQPILRFGPFEVDVYAGELRRNGAKVHIQDKPLRLLEVLAGSHGKLVTREELHRPRSGSLRCTACWPESRCRPRTNLHAGSTRTRCATTAPTAQMDSPFGIGNCRCGSRLCCLETLSRQAATRIRERDAGGTTFRKPDRRCRRGVCERRIHRRNHHPVGPLES